MHDRPAVSAHERVPRVYFQAFNHDFWIMCIDTKRIYAIRPSLAAMSYDFRTISRTILILAVTALLVPAGLSGVQVHASSCATGLSPNLHLTLWFPRRTQRGGRGLRSFRVIAMSRNRCCKGRATFQPQHFDRALSPTDPNVLGKTFDQGGFDILFVGYNLGIDPDPYSHTTVVSSLPPGPTTISGTTLQNDNLDNLIKTTLNATTRNNYVKQWQVLAANELPSIPILYTRGVVAFDSKFPNAQSVFNVYHFPAWPTVEHLSSSPVDGTFIFAETGQAPGQGVIPE